MTWVRYWQADACRDCGAIAPSGQHEIVKRSAHGGCWSVCPECLALDGVVPTSPGTLCSRFGVAFPEGELQERRAAQERRRAASNERGTR